MHHLAILGSGMMTGVGLTAAATCAAVRCKINHFVETRFMAQGGGWLIGCSVPLDSPVRGRSKLIFMVASAIRECLELIQGVRPKEIPLLLCVAEPERPGRFEGLDERLLREVQAELAVAFHPQSAVIARGRVGGAVALDLARALIRENGIPFCLVAGVDSLLVAATLNTYQDADRLLTSSNSNGFIPGEAAGAMLVGTPVPWHGTMLICQAIGFAREGATIDSDVPLRAEGTVSAIRGLHADGGVTIDDADYRITDCNGEQYGFKNDRLAYARTGRQLKARFDHHTPAECFGEVGAAIGPCILGLALAAAQKGYAPGRRVLCHFHNDDGDRATIFLQPASGGAQDVQ
jgi:3-oxoacyl-[acyl-carrier-protein] synthase-1